MQSGKRVHTHFASTLMHTSTHTYTHLTQLLCIEHTTAGLERDRPISLGFLNSSNNEAAATLLGADDILARLGRHDERLWGVALRLRPPLNDRATAAMVGDGTGGVTGTGGNGASVDKDSSRVKIVELFTWSEEEYENLVCD